jgi:hypothetical protein
MGQVVLVEREVAYTGRARLLPSWHRYGSAGASPSRVMTWWDKVDGNMFREVASPSHGTSSVKMGSIFSRGGNLGKNVVARTDNEMSVL